MKPFPSVQIDQVCSLVVDCVNKTAPKVPGPTPWKMLRTPNIRNGRVNTEDVFYVDEDTFKKWTRRASLEIGDTILTREAPVGEVGLVREAEGLFLGQRLMQYRADPEKMDGLFLHYAMRSPSVIHQFHAHGGMGSVVDHLRVPDCKKFLLPFPPAAEQSEIAAVLGALDDKIEVNRKAAATLEAMARALYRSWFVDFDPVHAKAEGRQPAHMDAATAALFPDRFGDNGLPLGWEMTTVGAVADIVGGATPSTKQTEYWDGGHHLWATPKDLSNLNDPVLLDTERKITDQGLAKISSGLLPAGSLLLSSRAPIGYLAIAQRPVAINQGFIGIRQTDLATAVEAYHWCVENMDLIHANANGSTFQEIAKKNFRPMAYVLASEPVRRAFNEVSGRYFQRITSLCEENRTLANLRDTLLPRLMSGELRVGAAEKIVSEAI